MRIIIVILEMKNYNTAYLYLKTLKTKHNIKDILYFHWFYNIKMPLNI